MFHPLHHMKVYWSAKRSELAWELIHKFQVKEVSCLAGEGEEDWFILWGWKHVMCDHYTYHVSIEDEKETFQLNFSLCLFKEINWKTSNSLRVQIWYNNNGVSVERDELSLICHSRLIWYRLSYCLSAIVGCRGCA